MVVALGAIPGCERSGSDGPAGGPSARSESISVASTMPLGSMTTTTSASAAHAPAAPARKLCEGELAQPGRKLPKGIFTGVAASGEPRPAEQLPTDTDKWTWINFFAAWCGPCKEEMPRLRGFQQKLASSLDVVFVSLDDDERQLKQFLEAQARNASGVRSAFWLPPGKTRASWLAGLHLKESPDLPAHVLVDRSGKVRCVVGGAVEEADFATIASIVKR
jgi:thiol-disulfide isomerase/thioredoxin